MNDGYCGISGLSMRISRFKIQKSSVVVHGIWAGDRTPPPSPARLITTHQSLPGTDVTKFSRRPLSRLAGSQHTPLAPAAAAVAPARGGRRGGAPRGRVRAGWTLATQAKRGGHGGSPPETRYLKAPAPGPTEARQEGNMRKLQAGDRARHNAQGRNESTPTPNKTTECVR